MTSETERLNAALNGTYRIVRHLGEGGMASVYLCDDLRHGRQVALKLLKPELAARIGAERFVQEIRTTASLQHPHILPLFDSGSVDGFLFYVMPYIPGETLRARLERERQLPIDEALRIARDVAEALDYAHRQGIIHRDIKPENILLQDGRPLVADFGIALALSAATQGRMTETGLSLGTPHYMSPEQATADKDIGPRSDVYAIGSVLYEMLAGTPPHHGGSSQQVIMKILTEEPAPVTSLRKAVPAHVADAVSTALEKVPADRFATAKAFAEALGNVGYRRAKGVGPTPVVGRRRGVLLTTVAIVAAVAGTWMLARGLPEGASTATTAIIRVPIATEPLDPLSNIAGRGVTISPDGSTVIFATQDSTGAQYLWARALDQLEVKKLEGTDGAWNPAFSYDGTWVYFTAANVLKRVPVGGGIVERVTLLEDPVGYTGAVDGMVVSEKGQLMRIGYGETTLRPLVLGKSLAGYRPVAVGDGTRIVSSPSRTNRDTLELVDLTAGNTKPIEAKGTVVGYSGGYVLTVRAAGLQAFPISLDDGKLTGEAKPMEADAAVVGVSFGPKAALSRSGSLVYLNSQANYDLVEVSRGGEARTVSVPSGAIGAPRVSPDGRSLLYDLRKGEERSLWAHDLVAGGERRLTDPSISADRAEWTSDGKSVVFRSRSNIYVTRTDGAFDPRLVVQVPGRDVLQGIFSPDGRFVLYRLGLSGSGDLFYRAVDDTVVRPFAQTSFSEHAPRFSPDGRWVAFVSDETGKEEVYLQRFPDGGPRIPISTGGGTAPVWSRDGRELFYFNNREFMAATLSGGEQRSVLNRSRLFSGAYNAGRQAHAGYDVSADGNRFYMLRPIAGEGEQLVLVVNWITQLNKSR